MLSRLNKTLVNFVCLAVIASCGKKATDEFAIKAAASAKSNVGVTLELVSTKRDSSLVMWKDFQDEVVYRLKVCSQEKSNTSVKFQDQNLKFELNSNCKEFELSKVIDFSKPLPVTERVTLLTSRGEVSYEIVDSIDAEPQILSQDEALSLKNIKMQLVVNAAELTVLKNKIDGSGHLLMRYQLDLDLGRLRIETDCSDYFNLTSGRFKLNLVWVNEITRAVIQQNEKDVFPDKEGILVVKDELNIESSRAQNLSLYMNLIPIDGPKGIKAFWVKAAYDIKNRNKSMLEVISVESIEKSINMRSYESLVPKPVNNKIDINHFSYVFHKASEEDYRLDKNLKLKMARIYEIGFTPKPSSLIHEKQNFFLKYYLLTKKDGSFDVENVDLNSYSILSSGVSKGRIESGSGRSIFNLSFDFNDLTKVARKNLILIEIQFDGVVEKQFYISPFQMFGVETNTLLTNINENQIKRLENESNQLSLGDQTTNSFDIFKKALKLEVDETRKSLIVLKTKKNNSPLVNFKLEKNGKLSEELKHFYCNKFFEKTPSKKSFFDVSQKTDAYSTCVSDFEKLALIKKIQIVDRVISVPEKISSFNGNLVQSKSEAVSVTFSKAKSKSTSHSVNFGLSTDLGGKLFNWVGITSGVGASASYGYSMSWSNSETRSQAETGSFSISEGINFVYNQMTFAFDASVKQCVVVSMPDQFIKKTIARPSSSGAIVTFSEMEIDLKSKATVLTCEENSIQNVQESWYFVKQRNFDNTYLYDDQSEDESVLMQVMRGVKHFEYFKNKLAQSKGIVLYRHEDKNDLLERIKKHFSPAESSVLIQGMEINSFPGMIEVF